MASKQSKKRAKAPAKSGGDFQLMKYKWWVVGAIAVYALTILAFNYKVFLKDRMKNDVLVQTISHFSGTEKPCGAFTAEDITPVGADKFAVSDSTNRRILIFDRNNNFIRSWGKEGKGPREFSGLMGISSDERGNVYAIDAWSAIIRGYTEKGELFQSVPLTMGCYGPRGILWDSPNFVISDTGSHRLLKVTANGELVEKWGQKQSDCKQCLNNPCSAISDGKGNYYVADFDNRRVALAAPGGKLIKLIEVDARPNDIALDGKGNLYICSAEGAFVKVYNTNGDFIGNLKDIKGEDMFASVRGMSFAPDGTLLLAENGSVAQVKILPPGTKTPQQP